MSEFQKARVLGPIIIGCLIAVSAGGAIFTAVESVKINKEISVVKQMNNELNSSLKYVIAEQASQRKLLSTGAGGTSGDMVKEVKAALDKINSDTNQAQQAELYKNWNTTGVSKDGHYMYGNQDARFTLVTYSDLECPFCKRFHETPKYLVDSAKNGMVNWEWRHYPLSFHEPLASKAAMMAECVAKQKGSKGFWAFTENWFNHTAGNGQGFAGIDNVPALFGVDKTQFDACMTDPEVIKRIKDDMQAGNQAGVTGTPATLVIDNKTGKSEMIVGAQPFNKFVQVIESMANPQEAAGGSSAAAGEGTEQGEPGKK